MGGKPVKSSDIQTDEQVNEARRFVQKIRATLEDFVYDDEVANSKK